MAVGAEARGRQGHRLRLRAHLLDPEHRPVAVPAAHRQGPGQDESGRDGSYPVQLHGSARDAGLPRRRRPGPGPRPEGRGQEEASRPRRTQYPVNGQKTSEEMGLLDRAGLSGGTDVRVVLLRRHVLQHLVSVPGFRPDGTPLGRE